MGTDTALQCANCGQQYATSDATDRVFSYASAVVRHAWITILAVEGDGKFVATDPPPDAPLVPSAVRDALGQFFAITPEFTVPASARETVRRGVARTPCAAGSIPGRITTADTLSR